MRYQTARDALAFNLRADVPSFLIGPPGIGKTDMVAAACRDLGLPLHVETLSTMEPVDLRGLPFREGDSVKWSKPDFLARLESLGSDSVLFIDEANANAQAMQVPLMQLALARRIGPHKLPDGCRVVLAGNRQSDRAAATRIPTALANRVCFLDVEPDLKAWLAWAAAADIHPAVIAFLMLRGEGTHGRPGLLFNFDPSKDARSFASPRAWHAVSKVADAPDSIRHALVDGLVGEAAAAEFEGFLRVYRALPPLPAILADPHGSPVPSDPSTQYAVAVALSRASNPATFGNALAYMQRVGAEFAIVTATDAVRRKPELADTPAYIRFAAANSDVFA